MKQGDAAIVSRISLSDRDSTLPSLISESSFDLAMLQQGAGRCFPCPLKLRGLETRLLGTYKTVKARLCLALSSG